MKDIEGRLESLVEGLFARVFKGGIRPVEIARRLAREMDNNRSVGVSGEIVVPNEYRVHLAPEDLEELSGVSDSLSKELASVVREHARTEQFGFMGPVAVNLIEDPNQQASAFRIASSFVQADGGRGAGSLVLPNGERVLLGEFVVSVGRLPDCTITINDPNVSRNHAEIRPYATGYKVVDLGSTNGTRVNDARVVEHELVDGDILAFGQTAIEFNAS